MKKERLKLPWPDSSSKPVLNRIAAPPMNFFKNKAGAAPGIGESKISNSPFPGNRGAVPQRQENPSNITGAFARATAPPPGGVPAGKKFIFGKKTESSTQQLASPKDSETRRLQFDTPSPEGPLCSPVPAAAHVTEPAEPENRPTFKQPFFDKSNLERSFSIHGNRTASGLDSGRRCLEDAYTDTNGQSSETQKDEHTVYSDENGSEINSMNTGIYVKEINRHDETHEKETCQIDVGGEPQQWAEAQTWTSSSKQNQQDLHHEDGINHTKVQEQGQQWEQLPGGHALKQQEHHYLQRREIQKDHHQLNLQHEKLQQEGATARKVSREGREGLFSRPSENSTQVQANPQISSSYQSSRPKQQRQQQPQLKPQPQPQPQLVERSQSSALQLPPRQKVGGRPQVRSTTHPTTSQNAEEGQNQSSVYLSHEDQSSVASSHESSYATPPIAAAPSEEPQRRHQSSSAIGAAAARLAAAPIATPLESAQKSSSMRGNHHVQSSDPNLESAVGKRNYWSRSECNTEFGKESRKALTEIKQYRDALTALERGGLDNMVLVAQQHAITLARIASFQVEFTEINALQTKISSLRSFVEKEFQLADDDYDRAQKGLLPIEYHPEDLNTSKIDNSSAMHDDSSGAVTSGCVDAPPNVHGGLHGAVFADEEKNDLSPDVRWEREHQDTDDVEAENNIAGKNQCAVSMSPSGHSRETLCNNNLSGAESSPHTSSETIESDVNSAPFTSPERATTNSNLNSTSDSDLSKTTPTSLLSEQSNKNVYETKENVSINDGRTGPDIYRPQVLHFTGEAEEERVENKSSLHCINTAEDSSHPNESSGQDLSSILQNQSYNNQPHHQDISVDSSQST